MNLSVRKLPATAGMGLSKTPTAEIERSLCGSTVSSVSKVTFSCLRCTGGGRAHPVQEGICSGISEVHYEKDSGVVDINVRKNFKCRLAQDGTCGLHAVK